MADLGWGFLLSLISSILVVAWAATGTNNLQQTSMKATRNNQSSAKSTGDNGNISNKGRGGHSRSEIDIETTHDRWAGTEIIYYGWDHYIADASTYNRSFPCTEATLML